MRQELLLWPRITMRKKQHVRADTLMSSQIALADYAGYLV